LEHAGFSGSDLLKEKQVDKMGNMETKQTTWEELSISNDFLFGKVMQDAELCKELLQRILPDLDIDYVEYPELQKAINHQKLYLRRNLNMPWKRRRRIENGGMSI
jgi:hypothetical protein